jgi:hypothetical protein
MRKIILSRIEEIKKKENDFSKGLQRWSNFDVKGNHISEINFNDFDDDAVVFLFERIIIRVSKQM